MSLFIQNICKYGNCGVAFPTLLDLIEHIEVVHIVFDASIQEELESERLRALPFSYVLAFTTPERRKQLEFKYAIAYAPDDIVVDDQPDDFIPAVVNFAPIPSPTPPIATPSLATVSPPMEDNLSEDSDDSWCMISPAFIIKNFYRIPGLADNEKTLACPVPGCMKRYKNINGVKYHAKHGHLKNIKVQKRYRCFCGKNYAFPDRLDVHKRTQHKPSQREIDDMNNEMLWDDGGNACDNAKRNSNGNGDNDDEDDEMSGGPDYKLYHGYDFDVVGDLFEEQENDSQWQEIGDYADDNDGDEDSDSYVDIMCNFK